MPRSDVCVLALACADKGLPPTRLPSLKVCVENWRVTGFFVKVCGKDLLLETVEMHPVRWVCSGN